MLSVAAGFSIFQSIWYESGGSSSPISRYKKWRIISDTCREYHSTKYESYGLSRQIA